MNTHHELKLVNQINDIFDEFLSQTKWNRKILATLIKQTDGANSHSGLELIKFNLGHLSNSIMIQIESELGVIKE